MEEKEFEDELARRRSARLQARAQEQTGPQDDQEEKIHYSGKDILAFIIAAYQVLLPVLAGMIGILLFTWLLFKIVFS